VRQLSGGAAVRRLLPVAVLGPIIVALLSYAGYKAGLYSVQAERWLVVVAMTALVAGIVLVVARVVDESEAERIRAEQEIIEAAPALAERAEQLERANQELAAAKAQLEHSNEELQRFATVASHDLREPLRVVSGFAEMLSRRHGDQLDGDAKRFLEAIVSGVARMDDLVADLLAYARAGRVDEPFAPVDCNAVLADTLVGLRRAIDDAGAEVEVTPLPTVMGNARALHQLFQNLIANAVKFAGDDPPRVRIWAAEVPEGWRFSIRDNGIGVDRAQAERIFGMFTRVHGADDYPGTGVGLAICQRIVDVHGGRIWVEPAPGGGSQFMFTIADGGAAR
jgi:light-regulated signal transduction histidine kinase (bacteriophytochrome)